MINYIALGFLIMFTIEMGSPYPWTMFERVLIIALWPVALGIMMHALYKRLFEDE